MKKNLFLTIASLFLLLAVNAQTAADILQKFTEASGGREKLLSIHTLQMNGAIKINALGQSFDIPIQSFKEKGKLYRRQVGGLMGIGESWTLVTDTAGYNYFPGMAALGLGQGGTSELSKMSAEELRLQQTQMECAGAFSELIDYATKGHKATLEGKGRINERDCYKIKFEYASGGAVVYYFDAETYLVTQMDALGNLAADITGFGSLAKMFAGAGNIQVVIGYSNYQQIQGIQYPMKQVMKLGPFESIIEQRALKINEPIDRNWYLAK